jgi:thioredoxin-related protein
MLRSPSWLLIPVVLALASVAVVFSSVSKPHRQVTIATVKWYEDLDAAIQIAKRTGKDLLVNFTARRNCHACGLLKRQVLIQPEFLDYVDPRFVLVEIDKSMLEDDATKAAKLRRMEAWQFQYRAGSVPTVFLLDTNGRPFGITHHRDGGPGKFIEFLAQCQVAREHRDKLLKQASSLTGQTRAAMIDEALSVIDGVLSRDVTLDEPPLTVFHASEIDDILRLEPNAESPLHQKYAQLRRDAAEAQTQHALYLKFHEIADADGNDSAVKYADELLAQTTDKALIKRLKSFRRFYLEQGDRFQEELDQVLDELRDSELTADERHWLEDRQAFSLGRLGRRDEALAIINRWIVEAGDDRDKKRKAYQDKGQFQLGTDCLEAALAFDTAAEFSEEGSEEWWENKHMAAWGFLLGKDYATARLRHLMLLNRADLPVERKPSLLLDTIKCLLALYERDRAEELRPQLRQALDACPKDLLDPDTSKRLLQDCDQLFSEKSSSDKLPSSDQ